MGWEKPLWGWLKLNFDGSTLNNPGKAGGGGLLRDHEGMLEASGTPTASWLNYGH